MNELLTYEKLKKNLHNIVLNKIIKENCVWTIAMGLNFCPSETIKGTHILPSTLLTLMLASQTLKKVIETQFQAEVLV